MSRRGEQQRRELLQQLDQYKEASVAGLALIRQMDDEINRTRRFARFILRQCEFLIDLETASHDIADAWDNLTEDGRRAIPLPKEIRDAAQ